MRMFVELPAQGRELTVTMMPLDFRFDEPDPSLPAAILTHINFICHLLESL